MIYLCSCGFATDDQEWLDGHLFTHPAHQNRPQPGSSPVPGATGSETAPPAAGTR